MHRTPFRPLWTELKGFGSRRTVAPSPDGVHDCPMANRRFAPKDVLRETFLTQLAVAPDGSSVVYGRRTIEGGEYRTRLWRVPTSGGRAEQITSGEGDFRPRFSPDGTTLAFISSRSGKAGISLVASPKLRAWSVRFIAARSSRPSRRSPRRVSRTERCFAVPASIRACENPQVS